MITALSERHFSFSKIRDWSVVEMNFKVPVLERESVEGIDCNYDLIILLTTILVNLKSSSKFHFVTLLLKN